MSNYNWEENIKSKSNIELVDILNDNSFLNGDEIQEFSLIELLNRNYCKGKLFDILQRKWHRIYKMKCYEEEYLFNFSNSFNFFRLQNNYYRGTYLSIGMIFFLIFCIIKLFYIGIIIFSLLLIYTILLDRYSRNNYIIEKNTKIEEYNKKLDQINSLIKKYFEK